MVPATPKQKEIPYARVNHNKYMVTDKVAYIGTVISQSCLSLHGPKLTCASPPSGTSNWSGDYFVSTAGSALVVNQTGSRSPEPTVQSQLRAVFERDWNSDYSSPVTQRSDLTRLC